MGDHSEASARKLRVFLCHASSDKPAVRQLYQRLNGDNVRPWLDEEDLIPGQKWGEEIPKAVRASDVVIVCLSEKSTTKEGYVQKEIRLALDAADEKPPGTIFLLPLKLEQCNVPERLGHVQWVNYFEDRGYDQLLRGLSERAKQLQLGSPLPGEPSYITMATTRTPALIVYLVDISSSMEGRVDGVPKIQIVNETIKKMLTRMVARSTRGETIQPRYRLAMACYGDAIYDLLDGVQPIDVVARKGTPQFSAGGTTNTAAAFEWAKSLLSVQLPLLENAPAPLVCHLTDGESTGADPADIAIDIMKMRNRDGNVLVENIFVGTGLARNSIDFQNWRGFMSESEIGGEYHFRQLYRMSSALPRPYASILNEYGYQLQPGSRMLIPAESRDLVELGFAVSEATPMVG